MESDTNKTEVEVPNPLPADLVEAAEILLVLVNKRVTDEEAVWIEEVRQRPEVPPSDDEDDAVSSDATIDYRESPTPEPTPPNPTKPLSPPETLTESDDSKSRSSQEAVSRPLKHGVAKRKRGAENANSSTATPLAKKPRQRANKSSAKKQKSAAAKVPMTAEERKAAREAKAEEERQIYRQKAYKPRARKELDVKFDAIGVPLAAEGIPAELAVVEKKPRAARIKSKQTQSQP
ncbi:uncharacterized protein EAF01_007635 [Botrytis porri]|uniref:Uncharacterized protein n=1 Tax=Botrytis porri TaxID=87229 RepID=A0A4Z1KLF0_9HELO|nr:uncharacterized protein EAF01_007635 [Botrytis porri]KAF7900333.1 hypothetical protein EAF01_007635 [Botrytis porri]TGO86166.1 hypothetical protein BPOR_0328g00040 [Botrytis porri]